MDVVAYCRVSTDKSDQLHSLETQKQFFQDFANKEGYNLIHIYSDEGISGLQTKKRKAFLQMIEDAQKGYFEKIFVKDLTRFGRNTEDFLHYSRQMREIGVEIDFVNSNMTNMGNSEFILTVLSAIGQEESANLSKRVRFSKRAHAEKGKVPAFIYGYDRELGDIYNLTINEEEAKMIRRIFKMYTVDGLGANKIRNQLNEEGHRTRKGCKWSENAISRILRNELYIGRVINCKEEITDFLTGKRKKKDRSEWLITERPEFRIVDDETFARAQEILESRHYAFKTGAKHESNKYLFSSLIKCKDCGWSFRRVERTYKNTHIYWVCSGHNGQGADSCPNAVTIDENELMGVIQNYFTEVLKNKEHLTEYVVKEFEKKYRSYSADVDYGKEIAAKTKKAENARQKYMEMYEENLVTLDEIKEKMNSLNAELEQLRKEQALYEESSAKRKELESILMQTFDNIEAISDIHQMSNIQIKRIIDRIEVDKDGNVDIFLRLFTKFGIEKTVPITDNDT